jgi:hypothetical protein
MTRAKRILIARVAFIVLFGALAVVASASAEPAREQTPETVTPVSETVAEPSPPAQLVSEPVPEAPATGESGGTVGKTETPSEVVVEPVTETLPAETVSEPVTHEEALPAEAVKEPPPEPAPIVNPVPEVALPVVVLKEVASSTGDGQAAEGALVSLSTSTQEGPPSDPPSAPALDEGAAVIVTPVSASSSEQQERSAGAAGLTILAPVRLTAAQRAADLTCELSGLSGPMTRECAVGLSDEQGFPASAATLAAGAAATGTGAPPSSDYGGSSGGGRSVAPPPGPAPSGAFGGASAGGAGGAFAGFFTLACLLLLAGPRAMRRLRLSCMPWLTAFFVLIPERPG